MNCRLCDNLILSEAVTFADGTLTINIPAGSYANGQRYCMVIAQAIPATTTVSAPVVITIGTGTTTYPLVNRCCAQVTARGLRTRTKYSVVVATAASTNGAFRMVRVPTCCIPEAVPALTGAAATT